VLCFFFISKVSLYTGILGDKKTAVIEMAAASGLTLVPENKRNPLITTTYGTGQLIKAALNQGCRKMNNTYKII
jgi:glycerate kinase